MQRKWPSHPSEGWQQNAMLWKHIQDSNSSEAKQKKACQRQVAENSNTVHHDIKLLRNNASEGWKQYHDRKQYHAEYESSDKQKLHLAKQKCKQ